MVGDGTVFADNRGYGTDMNHREVLHVRIRTDVDVIHFRAHHDVRPYAYTVAYPDLAV